MKAITILTLASLVLATGCGQKSSTTGQAATNASTGNPLTAPVDYLGAVGKAQQSAEKVADIAPLTQAVQAYYAENNRYPKDLNELVEEKYIPCLPEPPYGMKIDYDATTGKVKVVRK